MAVSIISFSRIWIKRFVLTLAAILICLYIWIAFFKVTGTNKGSTPQRRFKLSRQADRAASAKTDGAKSDSFEEMSQDEYLPGQIMVKKMMKSAWDSYKNYAWGQDGLNPVSKHGLNSLGPYSLALTAVDALDTLMIMHMDQEYLEARDLVLEKLSFDVPMKTSFFESNIRIMGGLLSAFALSGDARYVTKAFELAQRFLVAFENGQVFPSNKLDLMGHMNNTTEAPDTSADRVVLLAQIGTFSLEFAYLSDVLSDPSYVQKALAIIERMSKWKTGLEGLYPASIYPNRNVQPDDYYSLGGLCDSFYEYLLKYWIYTGKRDQLHHDMYKRAVAGLKAHLIKKKGGHFFMVNHKADKISEEQEQLACFMPGVLALGAMMEEDQQTLQLAEALTEPCYLMYQRQKIGLGPEFININNFQPIPDRSYWVMRPSVVESIFVMWRITRNPQYRIWGLEIARAIEKHASVETGGYSGIENVLEDPLKKTNRQESYFLSETLKYLYLLFAPSDVLPLEEWVFNTGAHPFPINWGGTSDSGSKKDSGLVRPRNVKTDSMSTKGGVPEELAKKSVSGIRDTLGDAK